MQLALYNIIRRVVSKFHVVIIPTEGKRPHPSAGRTIKHFWTRPPSQKQIETWFNDKHVKSYAILCGSISGNLFVLDFDQKKAYRTFKKRFPEIAQTLTVRTRRGYHVYLRSEQTIRTQKLRDGDLIGEGSYVIGPESTLNNLTYKTKTNLPIRQVTTNEIADILKETQHQNVKAPHTQLEFQPIDDIEQTSIDLINKFRTHARTIGRNNALYKVARYAKATGVSKDILQKLLVHTYIHEPTRRQHLKESQQQRYQQAIRTIKSAYTSKINLSNRKANKGHLPTALREKLLRGTAITNKEGFYIRGSSIPGRLLEALMIEGIYEGQEFTIQAAQTIGKKYRIGTTSVYQTLRGDLGQLPNGKRLFRIVIPPYVRDTDNRTINKNNSAKGRTIQFRFQMPSIKELCSMYDIIPQSWDSLKPEDLISSKAYKEAIHREFIRRCSPEQSVTYLANRLGCHPRTIYRYDADLDVKTIPIFGFIPLTWANVDAPQLYGELRPDGITPGKWLQRLDGKRFPSVKGIALRQLSQGKTLVACERQSSKRTLSQLESDMTPFTVIWRRSDLPIGECEMGGSPYVLPAFGPDIAPPITADKTYHKSIRVSEPRQSNPTSTENNLALVRSKQKQILPHPMLNHSLTLVPGIGLSRQNKLYDLGILTLSDLVNASPQQLVSEHWYGGYVTINTILSWQEEAAILLGWRERGPAAIEKERRKHAINIYRKYLKRLMKYVDKTFTVINSIAPIEDLPDIEPAQTYLKLKSLEKLSKQRNSMFYKQSRKVELHDLACRFFIFYHKYIDSMLSLKNWELEEYGFENHAFWKRQAKRLDLIESQFYNILLIEA